MISWIALSLGSAFFAGLVAIFSKLGIANIPSNLATAIRTIVVVVLAWIVVFITGAMSEVSTITTPTLIILVLSGIATGASWLFFFRALQLGDATKVVTVDRLSIVLTIIVGIIIFGESTGYLQILGLACWRSAHFSWSPNAQIRMIQLNSKIFGLFMQLRVLVVHH